MSVVVAIKDNDRVWVGCDSQITRGDWSKEELKGYHKIWKPSDDSQIVMGGVGYPRDINILSTTTEWVDELTKLKNSVDLKYIIRSVVPKAFKELEDLGRLQNKDGIKSMKSSFLFAYKDQVYEISVDGCVICHDDIAAIGSGYVECLGAWDIVKNAQMTAKEKLIHILRASCQINLYVNYPIIIMNSLDGEVETIGGAL